MSSSSVFIGRQPILDQKKSIYGYEILFRNGYHPNSTQENDINATLAVTGNLLQGYGYKKIIGKGIGFININAEILKKNIISSLSPEHFIFEILETTPINETTIRLIKKYYDQNFVFALDDFIVNRENIEKYKDIWSMIDIVKVDVPLNNVKEIKKHLPFFRENSIRLLAEKVETQETFDQYKNMNFTLFQGYFFAKPVILPGKRLDPQKKSVLNLISMVRKDTDITFIEKEFMNTPELSINLLKFINSSAMGISHKVQSIRSAISLIGRKQLLRWLILLSYSSGKEEFSESSPLISMVSQRSQAMKSIAEKIKPGDKSFADSAYLIGLISFLDVLFQIPLDDIVEEISLSQELSNAVLKMEGNLGEILEVAKLAERQNTISIEERIKKWNITETDFNNLILKSFQWKF